VHRGWCGERLTIRDAMWMIRAVLNGRRRASRCECHPAGNTNDDNPAPCLILRKERSASGGLGRRHARLFWVPVIEKLSREEGPGVQTSA
jgi:hypothetical protein